MKKRMKTNTKIAILVSVILAIVIISMLYIFRKGANVDGNKITMTSGEDKIVLEVCKDDLVKVNYLPKGKKESKTEVIGNEIAKNVNADINVRSNPMTIKTDKMIVKIDKKTQRISYYDKNNKKLLEEQDTKGIYKKSLNLKHNKSDNFYGINGYNATDDANSEGILRNSGNVITSGEQGYCGGPVVWSNNGYGLLVDSDGGNFNIKDEDLIYEKENKSPKKGLEYYIMVGNPRQIMKSIANVSGQSPMFPKWAMGFTNSEWGIDEKEFKDVVNTYREKQIPIDNYTFDFDWKAWGEDNYGEFRWNDSNFPSANTGELKKFADSKGIKMTGIMKPRIHEDTVEGKYAEEHKFWHKNNTGNSDYFSNKQVRELDFSNPECSKWYTSHLKDAYDKGISGWWNDEADDVFDNFQFINMQKALYEWQRRYTNNRVWSINRNFYLGAQKYAYAMWSGDIKSGFESMADQRPRMLSAINLGQSKWGMDTGGFNGGDPNPENYARWIQFSAFTPIFRVHGNQNQQRQPWAFGAKAEEVAKKAIQLRYTLIPYIYSYERQSYENGLGIVRPLIFDYPQDKKVANDYDSWMFGDYLLVSPVVKENETLKKIYLPKGIWIDYFTGKTYEGGKTIEYPIDSEKWQDIPLFIKDGAIIPNQEYMNYIGEKPVTDIYLDVFPSKDKTTFNYYDDDGKTYNYEKEEYFKQNMMTYKNSNGINFEISKTKGKYLPETKYYILKIHDKNNGNVKENDKQLQQLNSYEDLQKQNNNCFAKGKDKYGDVIYIKIKTGVKTKINIK